MTDDISADPKPAARKATAKRAAAPRVEKVQESNEPKFGKIVLFKTSEDTERPAIISRVHEDGGVDLTVFNSEGSVFVPSVELGDEPGTWNYIQP